MRKQRKTFFLLLILLGLISMISVEAADSDFKISVDPILPENQITDGVNYFDLRMTPSKEQYLKIRITNHTSEKVNLNIVYSDAKTTSQGVIEYSENQELKINAPTDYLFTSIVRGPSELVLKAKETKDVEIKLEMPTKEYDGFIAGGIEFIQAPENDQSNGALIAQRSHLVGVKLSENDRKLPTNLSLSQTIVGTKNYKSAILIALANENGNYVEDLSIHGVISKKGNSMVVLETKMNQMRMAPYSELEIPIYLDEAFLDSGDYQLKLTAESKDGFSKEWEQGFKVTKKDAELFRENQELWNDDQSNTLLQNIILIGIVSVVLIAIGVAIYLNRDKILKKIKGKR